MALPLHVKQLSSFLVGGGVIAVFGAILLYVQVEIYHVDEQVAFAVQLAVTLALNFAYNHFVTWRRVRGGAISRRIALFLLTRGTTQLISMVLFSILTSAMLQLGYMQANVVCLVVASALNYYSSHRFVFTAKPIPTPEEATA